jgi:hypothetical protein
MMSRLMLTSGHHSLLRRERRGCVVNLKAQYRSESFHESKQSLMEDIKSHKSINNINHEHYLHNLALFIYCTTSESLFTAC